MNPRPSSFYGLGIAPSILAILNKLNLTIPTPIQEQAIPQAIEGKDIMGIAQTGTGKTLAFGIPVIQNLLKDMRARALVLLPTRELAEQVNESLRSVGLSLGIKTAVLIGGEPMGKQLSALRRGPHIILATPGRLIDHLTQKTVSLKDVKIVVLDEADRMLDMGFAPQLKRIKAALPSTQRQTLLFSATMPDSIIAMAQEYLKLPLRVEIARSGTAAKDVTQELFFVPHQQKLPLLGKILGEYRGSVLVFSRTKFSAKRIASHLRALGHTAVELHSNRSLNQRREALDGFKKGRYRIVVATDIASRGIDVNNIELVLNYDLPVVAEDYVHRIGRTGRAGEAGHAISFARPDERYDVQAIERLMRINLPVSKLSPLPPLPASSVREPEESSRSRNARGFRPRLGEAGGETSTNRFHHRKPQRNFKKKWPRRTSS